MLTRPAISDEAIAACLQGSFALRVSQVTFLPVGWANNAAYRVTAENGGLYFLKLRQGPFDEIAVAAPAFLHAQGIPQVMAPLSTTDRRLWVHAHAFDWILYPYFAGQSGFDAPLSKSHWLALGRAMRAVHAATLPAELAGRVPREDYSPAWRAGVRAFDERVQRERFDDPTAASFAALWRAERDEIHRIVERAERLAGALRGRAHAPAVCHADLHGRNVLAGAGGELAIVDWDAPILAPKERDLMFVGGGVGGIWNDDREVQWFNEGYGPAAVDLVALAYYRYERIVEDIAEFAARVFGLQGPVEERRQALRLSEQFAPNNVVDIAHQTYRKLTGEAPG